MHFIRDGLKFLIVCWVVRVYIHLFTIPFEKELFDVATTIEELNDSRNRAVRHRPKKSVSRSIKTTTTTTKLSRNNLHSVIDLLSNINTRYYVYDETDLNVSSIPWRDVKLLFQSKNSALKHPLINPKEYDFLGTDARTDLIMVDALKQHSLRTYNYAEADFFIIPLITEAVKCVLLDPKKERKVYDIIFGALEQHPAWQRTHGHRHIMISTWFGHFEYRMMLIRKFHDAIMPFYDFLWNVTIADMKTRTGIGMLYDQQRGVDFRGWLKHERIRVTRSGFPLGKVPNDHVVLREPSWENTFRKARYFLFYHTRPTPFFTPNSTEFRRLPIEDPNVKKAFPRSSIGFGLPPDEYKQHNLDSKFCLAIRGDDPGSHSVLQSLKIGCIPVVISDLISDYSPPLPSTIQYSDFCFFFKERDFWYDPAQTLLNLRTIHQKALKEKLASMVLAQRIVLPDHPNSLWVQAFLREAEEALKQDLPDETGNNYRVRMKKEFGLDISAGPSTNKKLKHIAAYREGIKSER